MFIVKASGNEPLNYQWEWTPAESEEWLLCDIHGSNAATLTIPSVQKSNKGSYRCVISNPMNACSQTSEPANLNVGKNTARVAMK